MSRASSEAGAIVEWLIFGIVIVGVSMLVAWRFIEADRAQNDAQRALSESIILKRKAE